MSNTNYEDLKIMIVNQYAILENISCDKMITKLNALDFQSEFKKLRKNSMKYKIIFIICVLASLSLIVLEIYVARDSIKPKMIEILSALFSFSFIAILFQRQLSRLSLKLRLLGFLYEFYKK